MKRVVMVSNTFAPMVGGLERSVATARHDLEQAGHFCRVITPAFAGARESKDGVLRVPALLGVGRKKFSIPLRTSSRIRDWMEAIDPHLLHAHQPFLLGDTAWRMARLRRIPLIFTHHTFYERYAHYLRMDPERARRMAIELTTRFSNRCQLVIAPTESVRRMLLERAVTTPIEVVPSGIDVAFYAGGSRERGRVTLGLEPAAEVVGHVGRISQEKNLSYLIRATLRLLHSRPRAKLLLVGDGDRLDWAKNEFAQAGLGARLVAPGILAGAAVADAYAAMDVFVFASKTDTQGLVLAEAMAAGLVTVALEAPGASDCIEPERSGLLLAPTASEADFAAVVGAVLAEPARRQVLAGYARQRAHSYSRPECVRRLLDVYEHALHQYQPDPAVSDDGWKTFAERCHVEWAPVWEKVATAFGAIATRPEVQVARSATIGVCPPNVQSVQE